MPVRRAHVTRSPLSGGGPGWRVICGLLASALLVGPAVGWAEEPASLEGVEGQQLSGQLGKPTFDCSAAEVRATATAGWGDGSSSAVEVLHPPGVGSLEWVVDGAHTYAEAGAYSGEVTGTWYCGSNPHPFSLAFRAKVGDAPLTVTAPGLSGVAGQPLSGVVATIVDQDKLAGAGDLAAVVSWGDGGQGAAAVSGGGGQFSASATHTYASPGTYTFTVSVRDGGEASATAEGEATIAPPPPQAPTIAGLTGPVEAGRPIALHLQLPSGLPRPKRIEWFLDQRLVANCSGTTSELRTAFLSGGNHLLSARTVEPQGGSSTATLSLQVAGRRSAGSAAALHVIRSQQVFACLRAGDDPVAQIVPESPLPQPPSGCQTQVQAGVLEAVGCLTPYEERLTVEHGTFSYNGKSYPISYLVTANQSLAGVPAREAKQLLADLATLFEKVPCRSGLPCPTVQEAGSYYQQGGLPRGAAAAAPRGVGNPSAYIPNGYLESSCTPEPAGAAASGPTHPCVEVWVATGPVVIDGITYLPKPGTAVVIVPQFNIVVAGGVAEDVGALRLKQDEAINWRLPATGQRSGEDFPVLTTPDIGQLIASSPDPAAARAQFGSVGGMATNPSSAVHIAFSALGEAEITFAVQLPEPFRSESGNPVEVVVHATISVSEGLVVRYGYLGDVKGQSGVDADLGPIELRNFAVCFRHSAQREDPCPDLTGIPEQPSFGEDFWDASGEVVIGKARVVFRPGGEGVCNPPPPALGIGFGSGRLAFAGAVLETPGVPIAPGVDLEQVGAGFKDEPTYSAFGGCVLLGAGDGLVKITGNLLAVFVKAGNRYTFEGEALPDLSPPYLYTERFGLGVGGSVELDLPLLGSTRVGSGYVVYVDDPAAVAFGAGVDLSIPFGNTYENPPETGIAFKAQLSGAIGLAAGFPPPFLLRGQLAAVVKAPGGNEVNGTVVGILSDEPKSGAGGIALCGSLNIKAFGVSLGTGTAGFGYHWGDPLSRLPGDIHIGGSCEDEWLTSFERVSVQAAAARSFAVPPGSAAVDLRLRGVGAAALLRGPGGFRVPLGKVGRGSAARLGGAEVVIGRSGECLVVIEHPGAGRYRLRGVGSFSVALARRPALQVRLTGRGVHRALRYRLAGGRGALVFVEKAGRNERVIATAHGSGGTVRFTVPPGKGRRQILAALYRGGVPTVVRRVASLRAPSAAALGRVRGVKVRRTRGGVVILFRAVSGAKGYGVSVRLKDGLAETLRTNGRRLSITGIYPEVGGVVSVRALGDGLYLRSGPYTRARFAPYLKPRRR